MLAARRAGTLVLAWVISSGVLWPAGDVAALIDAGQYEQAEAAARDALGVARRASLTGAPLVDALDALARALVANGRVATGEAEQVARESLALATQLWGQPSPQVAQARVTLGTVLQARGRADEARAQCDEALVLLCGPDLGSDGTLVRALSCQAEALLDLDETGLALVAVDEALRLSRFSAATGRARLLDLRAEVLQRTGRWDEATRAAEKALTLRTQAQSPHPDDVHTQLLLGDAAWRAGRTSDAGQRYARAEAWSRATLRAGHPLRLRAAGRLATWEGLNDRLEQALPRHEAVLAEARVTFGPAHPRLADHLGDAAGARLVIGETGLALELLRDAVAVMERAHGARSPALGTPLHNLSLALAQAREWHEALRVSARALEVWQRAYGERDARVWLALERHADALAGAGQDADAVREYERALQARLRAGEGAHPATRSLRVRLAFALERLGRTSAAAAVAASASLGPRAAGARSREYADLLALQARLAGLRGDTRAAREWAVASDALRVRHLRSTVRFLGERPALRYVGESFGGRDVLLALLARGRGDGALRRAAFELSAQARNLVLDELAARARTLDPARLADAAQARLLDVQVQLATLLYRGTDPDGAQVEGVERELEAAERAAALGSVAGRLPREPERDLAARLAGRLAPRAALVSVVSYQSRPHAPERSYMAFVLRQGDAAPRATPLGPASEIDRAVGDWRQAVERSRRAGRGAALHEELAAAQTLADKAWKPLRPALRGVSRVYLVLDGSLHFVNFAALVDEEGEWLLESGPTFHQLGSEVELLAEPAPGLRPRRLLVVANPAFDERTALLRAPAAPAPAAHAALDERGSASALRGPGPSCARLGGLRFEPLPPSGREADEIAALAEAVGVPTTRLGGAQASEFALKSSVAGYALVHVASHAFVADAACASGAALSPLLFSGVALAGANRRDAAARDDEDGILTAQELAGLDLRVAEWVVLSGCDTGSGRIHHAEGVLGLQRGAAIAGARTVIMSLWPVEDRDARAFMGALYAARLRDGRDVPDALRAAGLAMAQRLRAEGRPADPARWAAFVGVGDWR